MAREADQSVTVLGAGPAGLAAAWHLSSRGYETQLFEASAMHGGNARTLVRGEFRFDTGPHRFHDRDPEATRHIRALLPSTLHEVSAPSRIFWKDRFWEFPLNPAQAMTAGGPSHALAAIRDLAKARIRRRFVADTDVDFGTWARASFGETISEAFLIPFSEKLWGLPAHELSPKIAGRRLPGFSIRGLLSELLHGRSSDHLEGRFLYPLGGFGAITDAMVRELPDGAVQYHKRIVGFQTSADRIEAVHVQSPAGDEQVGVDEVISTLPISLVAKMLGDTLPQDVHAAAESLRFRDLVIVFLAIDRPSVSTAACTYFSDGDLPFSRAHEPRNRCATMSPPGQTSLVVEFPCFIGDEIWNESEDTIVSDLVRQLDAFGMVSPADVIDSTVIRLRNAYPVYSLGFAEKASTVMEGLSHLKNLTSIGRSGSFFYGHVHDFISSAEAAAKRVHLRLEGES